MPDPLHVIIVEDSKDEAELMVWELRRSGFAPRWKRVETERDFLAEIKEPILDLILSDYSLPQFSGLRALELLRERHEDLPFILVSGTIGDEGAVEIMKRGATDYLLKDRLARLGGAVKRSLAATREKAELRAIEVRYKRLFETAQDGILILDATTGRICDVNPFLVELLGFSREEMLGRTVAEISPFRDLTSNMSMLDLLRHRGYARYDNLPLETKAGRRVAVEFICNAYHAAGARVIQCNVRDITERKQAEEKRAEFAHKLQALSHRLVEAQETERRLIARELHDEIGQALTVAQINLQAALQAPASNGVAHRLQETLAAVDHVLQQVRDLSLNLRPSLLDDLGLAPALNWLANRQAAMAGLISSFEADPLDRRLDAIIETECFRIAQEALTNVVRHARAKTVSVKLQADDEVLRLRVRDDGIGFDVAATWKKSLGGQSLGLLSMEERALLAGGGLQFNSTPGHGAEVHAWFPLRWRDPSTEAATNE